jgi:hypothetical protein
MIQEPNAALSQYLLFDFNGQKVAVTDLAVDEKGLRTNWVIVGETRHYSDEQTDQLLAQAFKDLFDQMEEFPEMESEPKPVPETEPEPEQPTVPVEKPSMWARLCSRVRELF